MRTVCSLAAALSLGVASFAVAAEPKVEGDEILLKEIWGYRLPGTRDVRELQEIPQLPPGKELFERSLIARIAYELGQGVPEEAEPGFAVPGVRLDALQRMRDVLAKDRKRPKRLRPDRPITIAFFSYTFAQYLRLDSVTRTERTITIKYHFTAHESLDSTSHFALIPLGTLPPGDYDVRLERLATNTSGVLDAKSAIFIDPDLVKRAVSGPFSFTVK